MIATDTLLKLHRLLASMEAAKRLNVNMSIWTSDIELMKEVIKYLKDEK